MLTTKEEAESKLCPQAIGPGEENWVMTPHGRRCIGYACMAWRWGRVVNVYKPTPDKPNEFTVSQEQGGYCGLAGRPPQMDKDD